MLQPFGTTTWKDAGAARGAEGDKSYVLGRAAKARPDPVIEVIVTSGGLDKLEVYRGLRVREVWFWRAGRITMHVLGRGRYTESPRSKLLADVDPSLLARLAERPDVTRSMRLLQRLLRRR